MVTPPGSLVGPYQIVRLLGAGGMAHVYLARHGESGRMVALKVVSPDPYLEAMFRHEAQVSASLRHPNVAAVVDVGVADDGTSYLAIELVLGVTLREALAVAANAGRALPYGFGVSVVIAAAAGLHHAHERRGPAGPLGIIHRDVSPSNLMVGFDGTVKVIDFGIARSRVRVGETARGIVKGKAGYMSPEQLLEEPLDRRSDVFSLAVVAYEATTQARAFPGRGDRDAARRLLVANVRPPDTVRRGYPAPLADVLGRALALDPAERFATAATFAVGLELAAVRARIPLGAGVIVETMRGLFPNELARGTGSVPVLVEATATATYAPGNSASTIRSGHATPSPEK